MTYRSPTRPTRIALAIIPLAAIAGLVWLAMPASFVWPTSLRLGLTLGAIASAFAVGLAPLWVQQKHQTAAHRLLERLEQMDEVELLEGGAEHLPALSSENPWARLCGAVAQRLTEGARLTSGAETSKAEAELKVNRIDDQRRRATDVLSLLPAPVVAINKYDEVSLTNQAAIQLLAADSSGNLDGRLFADISPSAALTEMLTSSRRRTAGVRSLELNWATPDGTEFNYRASCQPLTGRLDQYAGAVLVLEDISDRLAVQRRNAEFVSAASHEIKAPLAGIKAYVELLVDDEIPEGKTRDDLVHVIDRQADRLQRLIDNLLNLARMEAGVESVNKSSRALNEVLEEALQVVSPAAEKKQIEIVNDLSPMYLGIFADRDMMLQTAINLLSNAVKYTPEAGSITVRSRLEDSTVSFEVQDNGVGLSAEDCERVFERFYRAQNREMAPGTGLGLTLAKHIIEDVHGGRLSVASELGVGTTFRVAMQRHVQR